MYVLKNQHTATPRDLLEAAQQFASARDSVRCAMFSLGAKGVRVTNTDSYAALARRCLIESHRLRDDFYAECIKAFGADCLPIPHFDGVAALREVSVWLEVQEQKAARAKI